MLVQPGAVVAALDDVLLDFFILNDAALVDVDQEHLTGLQAAFFQDFFRRHVNHPGFRGQDHLLVTGQHPTRRTQAVAVEQGADKRAIGERQQGRAVPGFHQAAVVFVEGLLVVGHTLMFLPGFRHHHHHRVRQVAAGVVQQLQAVVELRRIRSARHADREQFVHMAFESLVCEQ